MKNSKKFRNIENNPIQDSVKVLISNPSQFEKFPIWKIPNSKNSQFEKFPLVRIKKTVKFPYFILFNLIIVK